MSKPVLVLEREHQKLNWLRKKVAEQERRVKALEELADDPLDEMFDREMSGADTQTVIVGSAEEEGEEQTRGESNPFGAGRTHRLVGYEPRVSHGTWVRSPRQLPQSWVSILTFLGPEGKTNAEVVEFIARENLKITPEAVRAGLMNYRRDFGMVENPKRGFYRATEKALQMIKTQTNESLATGEASEPLPTQEEAA